MPDHESEQDNSPETEPKTKAELFAENPERYEDLKEVLIVVKKVQTEDGGYDYAILNQCESIRECEMIETRLRDAMFSWRASIRLRSQQETEKNKSKIVRPSMLQGVRSHLNGRKR